MAITRYDTPGYHEYKAAEIITTTPGSITTKIIPVETTAYKPRVATPGQITQIKDIIAAQPSTPTGPSTIDYARDIGLSTLGPIGTLIAGLINRDVAPGQQTPIGQFGEILWQFNPLYQGWQFFVDKPEGGILAAAGTGGAGIIPGLPDPAGGDGGIVGILPELPGFPDLPELKIPGLPDMEGIKNGLILGGIALAAIYIIGRVAGRGKK